LPRGARWGGCGLARVGSYRREQQDELAELDRVGLLAGAARGGPPPEGVPGESQSGAKCSLALLLDHDDSVYHLRLQVDEDGSEIPRTSAPVAIPDGPVALTLGWRRSPSQHEPLGNARLWVDGVIGAEIARIDSYAQLPQRLNLGVVAVTGAAVGTVHLDTLLAVAADRY
jgi:hypothetical protein